MNSMVRIDGWDFDKNKRAVFFGILICLVFSACGFSPSAAGNTPVIIETPIPASITIKETPTQEIQVDAEIVMGCVVVIQLITYSGPGENYETTGELHGGDCVLLDGRSLDVIWVRLEEEHPTWVTASYLDFSTDPSTLPALTGRTPSVISSATPTIQAEISPTVDQSEQLPQTGCPQGCLEQKEGCVIKGNISFSTGEKIFHVPGGEFYSRTQINSQQGERWFCMASEAIANGWRQSSR